MKNNIFCFANVQRMLGLLCVSTGGLKPLPNDLKDKEIFSILVESLIVNEKRSFVEFNQHDCCDVTRKPPIATLIIHLKNFLSSDWFRAVKFIVNTSAQNRKHNAKKKEIQCNFLLKRLAHVFK